MVDDQEQITYGQPGYQTLEDEIAARREAREYFRRRILRAIRGRLRERRGFRLRIALLLAACAALAYILASIPLTAGIEVIWRSGLAVLATWPFYAIALFLWARIEGRHLDMAGHWPALQARDQLGEFQDQQASQQVDRAVHQAWASSQCQSQGGGGPVGILALGIATLGTWLIWDLLRMGPALMAEIILDGVLVPIYPEIQDRLPSEPWYKTALLSTLVHFFAASFCTVILVTIWKYIRLAQGNS